MHNGRFASTRHGGACVKDPELRLDRHRRAADARRLGARAERDESFDWVRALTAATADRDEVIADLYALLLRGAHFELARRRASLAHLGASEVADLATQSADDALVAILAKLEMFRGASRFTTWAYKFVLLEAGVKARRRAWHGREIALDDEAWAVVADGGSSAQELLECAELMRAIRDAMQTTLTSRQREVFSALALNGVPVDVLAERLNTTRGALYTTLHGARRQVRRALADAGLAIDSKTARRGRQDRVAGAFCDDDPGTMHGARAAATHRPLARSGLEDVR
jgi:RNA polymerase sigma-70 factor, ECF subfamily